MTSESAANGVLDARKAAAPASSAVGVTHIYGPDSETLEPAEQDFER